ncbi:hypothetical protein [Nocardiopsis sp. FIRDI 009]|uniref:hypothetical protein n=1 Tax=Nocardiopsis sp. FIRDI 009 TaxID=714197 RepID=UPI0013007600|nr:hypothetical protein [Nocardiopsis sp. FIRDI 009]
MTPAPSIVPLHTTPPTSPETAELALMDMHTTLVQARYVPHVDWGQASIDARLYANRDVHNGRVVGADPIAAVCLRLHQATPHRLEWVAEFPARTPDEWEMPDRDTSTRRLAILGPATPVRPPHPQDLALVDYLIDRVQPEQKQEPST